jgi:uncharacterized protein (TIGR02118 family)
MEAALTTLSVIYPRSAGATFDYSYYQQTHLPLVTSRWQDAGLVSAEALRGISTPDGGESPFFAIALISFQSHEHLGAALAGEHTPEIMEDIANFTSVQPIVQLNEGITS